MAAICISNPKVERYSIKVLFCEIRFEISLAQVEKALLESRPEKSREARFDEFRNVHFALTFDGTLNLGFIPL